MAPASQYLISSRLPASPTTAQLATFSIIRIRCQRILILEALDRVSYYQMILKQLPFHILRSERVNKPFDLLIKQLDCQVI